MRKEGGCENFAAVLTTQKEPCNSNKKTAEEVEPRAFDGALPWGLTRAGFGEGFQCGKRVWLSRKEGMGGAECVGPLWFWVWRAWRLESVY